MYAQKCSYLAIMTQRLKKTQLPLALAVISFHIFTIKFPSLSLIMFYWSRIMWHRMIFSSTYKKKLIIMPKSAWFHVGAVLFHCFLGRRRRMIREDIGRVHREIKKRLAEYQMSRI